MPRGPPVAASVAATPRYTSSRVPSASDERRWTRFGLMVHLPKGGRSADRRYFHSDRCNVLGERASSTERRVQMHVVATAGHVDHGKSALLRALTGMEPDRWEEERRRGLTIDLGFVWTDGTRGPIAFVDVPGHERFVGNMLAGVGPVPGVLFVVAADEGWMPQSAEHLLALHALGVRHGVLAVTKTDLMDPGLAAEEALDEIRRTSLGEIPWVGVSARTGAGLPEL